MKGALKPQEGESGRAEEALRHLGVPSLQRGPLAPRQGHGAVRDLSVKTSPTTSLRKRLPRALCSVEWEHTRAPSGTWGGVCARTCVHVYVCVHV